MLQKIRRIVTGHNEEGKSVIVSDEASPHTLALSQDPPLGLTNLWITDSTPADNTAGGDAASRRVALEPPKGGTIFRVVEFPPERELFANADRAAMFAAMSASRAMDHDASRHPMMHKTSTVDYAIVLSGEIYAIMDVGETLMHAGDCLVQRGTNHAWANRSDEPCLVAFILIDANPV